MPRPTKGARLWLDPSERTWVIRDGSVKRRTGCSEADRQGAEEALGVYISEKFRPASRESDLSRLSIAEVLTAYGREHAPHVRAPATIGYSIAALAGWWGERRLSDIRGATCRAYLEARLQTVKSGTARRELGVLQAAINHWNREHGPLNAIPEVSLPPAGSSRDRWLSRAEAAYLLAGALGWYREIWCDVATRQVRHRWRRYALGINRHLARFILLGLYTGTRRGALLEIQWMPNTIGGWVDLNRGVLHRRSLEQGETKKRRPPARLGRRILAHLRRWHGLDADLRAAAADEARERGDHLPMVYLHVVAWRGGSVSSVRTAWAAALDLAWLGSDVTPHVLRHTRATWMMQQGVDPWETAGFLGMSVQMLQNVYGHHHPDFQRKAAEV